MPKLERYLALIFVALALFLTIRCSQKVVAPAEAKPAEVAKPSPASPPPSVIVPPPQVPPPVVAPPSPISQPTPPPQQTGPLNKISWEKYPENKPWSDFVYDLLMKELLPIYDTAKDAELFCPKYRSLNNMQKATMWTEMWSAISFFESTWTPTSRMKESRLDGQDDPIDAITGDYVYSEGLVQMSYQDIQWAKYCKFDWSKDKTLRPKDPKKTILDPFINLECGMRVMAGIIKKKSYVMVKSGFYWAVIIPGGRYEKIEQITDMTKKLAFCN